MATTDDGFLTRWSRRKVQAQRGAVTETSATELVQDDAPQTAAAALDDRASSRPGTTAPPATAESAPQAATTPPPPTLDEAQRLDRNDDFTRFVGRNVDPEVSNAAMKTLFSDPHFNVMDGLDTYIDDYGKPDPLPAGMLRRMAQSAMLGLFADERSGPHAATGPSIGETVASPSAPSSLPDDTAATPPDAPTDEDTDLRLQPDDDAGCTGAEPGAGEDRGRER